MKTRILSALVVLIITIPLVILGGIWFKIGVAIIATLGYKEIMDLRKKKPYPKVVQALGLIAMLYIILFNLGDYALVMGISYKTITVLLLALLIPVIFINNNDKYSSSDALFLIGSVLLLATSFNIMINVRIFGLMYFIYLFVITISTDTFAQVGGILLGKHKLTKISPKKTWEGSICGSLLATIIATIFYTLVIGGSNIFLVIFITLILSVISQLGDLTFSALKRLIGIKDYSNIMPGHGGILDRLDSIIFVLLAFSLIVSLL